MTHHTPRRRLRVAALALPLLAAGLASIPTAGVEAAGAPARTPLASEVLSLAGNLLTTTVDAPSVSEPGDPIPVTGRIVEHAPTDLVAPERGVPASFTLQVADPTGAVLATQDVTAAGDGTWSTTVPGAATRGVAPAPGDTSATLSLNAVDATYDDATTGAWAADQAGTGAALLVVAATGLELENSFVSSVGWVKPGDTYPSTITLTNRTGAAVRDAVVRLTAPLGSTIRSAKAPAGSTQALSNGVLTWTVPEVPAGTPEAPGALSLVLESATATTTALPTVVWRDLSSTATLSVGGTPAGTASSHGPKVIPPSEVYDTARYGDRPFPIVPVQYLDRAYQDTHSGDSLESVINDPDNPGSTFNLFQEMSLGQLFPEGTVPSAGIGTADFSYAPGFEFTEIVPGQTCTGVTVGGLPQPLRDAALPDRITNGVYNLPGQTQYYGADANGSAVVGSVAGVGALQNIDSGCGPTGKLVADAAAIADPEVDYSDFDTDKDGVVDFFMVVYAGCGGNGASQIPMCTDAPSDAVSYDNIWPHSSSLEGAYTDPVTGLPGFTTDDQLKDLEGRPLWWTDATYSEKTTVDKGEALEVLVRVGPYNVNPETAIDAASVISHEYGHSLGLPDFYSTGSRATYGDWNLMATDKSQNMDAFSRQELGWVVPEVLAPGVTTERDIPDSKQDIGTITWQRPDGTPYTLTDGPDGTVHNSQMYVAKLPGRTLLDASVFDSGDKATKSHLWWSGSGNDFGCSPQTGRNFDLAVPGLADLEPGTPVTLSFKSNWDIEWDFDYGYVLTTTDGGETYQSHPSTEGYTTSNTDLTSPNVNQVGCQATYDNGLTGTSGSYQAGTEAADRKLGNTPAGVFLADSYDVSDLAGEEEGAIRFSYSTDPGLARPGWFVDDVVVTATVDGVDEVLYETDFEQTGGPKDPAVFNGGCANDLSVASRCTQGWKYLQAGAASEQDHAYYLEMRDRSGFDLDGKGEADRGAVDWSAGLYLSYTDEAHGYGNVGTDDPPAQSPLDSTPEPGSATPVLADAAFTTATGRSTFTDAKTTPHVDNYTDPTTTSGNWEFAYDCLGFRVDEMTGAENGPAQADGDLTGDVTFTIGTGCGDVNYGYVDEAAEEPGPVNTAPVARATATPNPAVVGQSVQFSGLTSSDAETTAAGLTYSWDLGDGGSTKDAEGAQPSFAYSAPGTYQVRLTVDDGQGLTNTVTLPVTVTGSSTGDPGTTPGNPGTGTTTTTPGTTPGTTQGLPGGAIGPVRTQTRIRLPKVVQVRGGTPARLLFQVVAAQVSGGTAGTAVLKVDRRKVRSYVVPVTAKSGTKVAGLTYRVKRSLKPGPHSFQVSFTPADATRYTASRSRLIQLTVLPSGTRLRNAVE